jgi:MSHA pilin protein MshC
MLLYTKAPLLVKQRGFSLIELITVIVLIGILAVFIAPRFSNKDVFADYATQDLIIAGARIAQQRAMYDHSASACFRLNIVANTLFAQSFNGSGYDNIGPADWSGGITIDSAVTVNSITVYFDALGNALSDIANCACSPITRPIPIDGSSNLQVCVYSTGHLQKQVQTDACS